MMTTEYLVLKLDSSTNNKQCHCTPLYKVKRKITYNITNS